jgi:hypothetical protein
MELDTKWTAIAFSPLKVIELRHRVEGNVERTPDKVYLSLGVPKACLVNVPERYMNPETTLHEVIRQPIARPFPKEEIGE